MLFKTISRHLRQAFGEYQTRGRTDAKMEGPAYFLIGCPVIRRVRAGTDCHRPGLRYRPLATYRYFGPIVLAIIALLFIVALSYTQVVRVNPGGGGSYGIAMKYLGVYPALTAGAALLADYILTVAVSISSGRRRWSVPFRSSTLITSTLTSAFSS